jgi:hypothetical protein
MQANVNSAAAVGLVGVQRIPAEPGMQKKEKKKKTKQPENRHEHCE